MSNGEASRAMIGACVLFGEGLSGLTELPMEPGTAVAKPGLSAAAEGVIYGFLGVLAFSFTLPLTRYAAP
jgi:hypothetical protein